MPLIKNPVSRGKSSFFFKTNPTVRLDIAMRTNVKKKMALAGGGVASWLSPECVALASSPAMMAGYPLLAQHVLVARTASGTRLKQP
jgi:hypothetical protein